MDSPTIGVAIVAKSDSLLMQRAARRARIQAESVVTLVNGSINLSTARNRAAKHLDTDVIAFVDADALPSAVWVEELRKGYEEGALAVGGPAEPYMDSMHDRIPTGWEWLVGIGPFYDDIRYVRNTYGCNFSMRSDVFWELGGFDESMGLGAEIPHGEETDLATRMHEEYGKRMLYRPAAVVMHRVDPEDARYTALLRRAYEQGYTKARMGSADEENSFVRDRLLAGPSTFEVALLASAGLGAVKGWIHG